MPIEIKPTFRSSSEGVNYDAVRFAIGRSARAENSEFRTVESLKAEQKEVSETRHRVRVRRRHSPGNSKQGSKLSKRGAFYIGATIAMIVFVKMMISHADQGGPLEGPRVEKAKQIFGN